MGALLTVIPFQYGIRFFEFSLCVFVSSSFGSTGGERIVGVLDSYGSCSTWSFRGRTVRLMDTQSV